MDFEKWFESFCKSENNPLATLTIKEMLEMAYTEGHKDHERNSPLYVRDIFTGALSEVPREDNESLLGEGEVWADNDIDLITFLKEKKDEQK